MKRRTIAAAILAALMVVPALAADEAKKKGKGQGKANRQNAATQLLKQLDKVGLTDEQTAKAKELGKVAGAKMKEIRDAAGITAELTKKRAEAMKSLKESGKKGKELQAAINEAAGFSEAQSKALQQVSEVRMGFQKSVLALLTDDQKAKLPERLQKAANAKGGNKGKGNKKKKDAA